MAIANELGIKLQIKDFERIRKHTPILQICDQAEIRNGRLIGGIQVALRKLLSLGVLNGNTLTVTGETMRENISLLASRW